MFHIFFQFPCKVEVFMLLFSFFFSYNFTLWSAEIAKSTILQVLIFLLIIIKSGRLIEIKGSDCMSKLQSIIIIIKEFEW